MTLASTVVAYAISGLPHRQGRSGLPVSNKVRAKMARLRRERRRAGSKDVLKLWLQASACLSLLSFLLFLRPGRRLLEF